jgi:arylsulfatase A-like enzyme
VRLLTACTVAGAVATLLGCDRGERAEQSAEAARAEQSPQAQQSARPSRPNVILYLIDALRADHLGTYGYARPTSPVIDALAARGVTFERAYAQDSRTLGSVPALLTGLYVPAHGVANFGQKIRPEVTTLAEAMRDAGYATASFVTNRNAGRLPGLDRGFETFHDVVDAEHAPSARRTLPEKELFGWLDRAQRPFFAYVHTAEPHQPYDPPPPYDTLFDPDYRGPTTGKYEGPGGYGSARDPADIAHVAALYDGEIRFADDGVARLLRGLEHRGLLDDTVLILTADHGEELFERGDWHHGHSLFEELIRVPLIFAGPGIPVGPRIALPVQLIDVAPTILDLAHARVLPSLEGESLVPLLEGKEIARLAGRPAYSTSTQIEGQMAVIQGRWKLITSPGGNLQLYDLARDPGERNNLIGEERQRVVRLTGFVRKWLERYRTLPANLPPRLLSPDDAAQLRALGYIE